MITIIIINIISISSSSSSSSSIITIGCFLLRLPHPLRHGVDLLELSWGGRGGWTDPSVDISESDSQTEYNYY